VVITGRKRAVVQAACDSIRSRFGIEVQAIEAPTNAERGAAIAEAIAALEPGDVLLIAGKGHESGQIVGDRVRPFTDHAAVAAALRNEIM